MLKFLTQVVVGASVVFGAILYGAFAWGCVTYYFYSWFILPIFQTLPYINLSDAIGMVMFISLFKTQIAKSNHDKPEEKTYLAIMNFIMPWLMLLFGLVVKYFLV